MRRTARLATTGAIATCLLAFCLAACGGATSGVQPQPAPTTPAATVATPSPTPSPTPYELALPQLKKTYTVAAKKYTCQSFLSRDGIEMPNGCVAFLQGSWDAYAPNWDKYAAQVEKGTYGRGLQVWIQPKLAFASFFACAASYGNPEAQATYDTRPDLIGTVKESTEFISGLWEIAHIGLCPKKGDAIKLTKIDELPDNRAALIDGKRISCGELFFPEQGGSCGDEAVLTSWNTYYERIPTYYGDMKAGKLTPNFAEWGTDSLSLSLQACDPKFAPNKQKFVAGAGLGKEYDKTMSDLYDLANDKLCPRKK